VPDNQQWLLAEACPVLPVGGARLWGGGGQPAD